MDTTAPADNPRRKSRRRSGLIAPSTFDRLAGDAYFTIEAPWIVPALLKHVRVAGLARPRNFSHSLRNLNPVPTLASLHQKFGNNAFRPDRCRS